MSAWTDALGVIENLAPTMASALGGPLAGGAIAALESILGLTPTPTASLAERQNALATTLSGATPDQLIAVRKADQDYAARMAEAGFKDADTLAALSTNDRGNARTMQISTRSTMPSILGCAIVAGSMAAAAAVLCGKVTTANTADATMVGTVIGYLFSEAKAVLSFYFGSSSASDRQTELLAQAPRPQTPPPS